jgi:chromosome segregation ATPase
MFTNQIKSSVSVGKGGMKWGQRDNQMEAVTNATKVLKLEIDDKTGELTNISDVIKNIQNQYPNLADQMKYLNESTSELNIRIQPDDLLKIRIALINAATSENRDDAKSRMNAIESVLKDGALTGEAKATIEKLKTETQAIITKFERQLEQTTDKARNESTILQTRIKFSQDTKKLREASDNNPVQERAFTTGLNILFRKTDNPELKNAITAIITAVETGVP